MVVRKIETDLDIQERDPKFLNDPSRYTELDKSTIKQYTDSDSMFDTNFNAKLDDKLRQDEVTQTAEAHDKLMDTLERPLEQDKKSPNHEKDVKLRDIAYDSDDVFANNPSSLMLAKFKVLRPKKPSNNRSIDSRLNKNPKLKPDPDNKNEDTQTMKNVKFDEKEQTLSKGFI